MATSRPEETPPPGWFLGVRTRPPAPPAPPARPGQVFDACAACNQRISRRNTGIGMYFWANSNGVGNCPNGGMHTPRPRSAVTPPG